MVCGLIGRIHNACERWKVADEFLSKAIAVEERLGTKERRYFGNRVQRSLTRNRLGLRDEAKIDYNAALALRHSLGLDSLTHVRFVREDLHVADELGVMFG